MMWRVWTFVAALPLGVLASLALTRGPRIAVVELSAVAAGLLLVALSSLVARVRDDDPARGAHLAVASSAALLATPACAAALLDLAPAPWLLAATAVALAVALFRGARVRGPSRLAVRIAAALGYPLVGAILLVVGAALVASLRATGYQHDPRVEAGVWDLDAQVATLELPDCTQVVDGVRVLAERGARPRLDAEGRTLWFDAISPEGRRQIHRLDLAGGVASCWTCGQPGNNVRPTVGPLGKVVVFDSDRHATWLDPSNTELYRARADRADRAPRRLSYLAGPDDHALLGPSAGGLVWSKRVAGRYAVVSAAIVSGHGGILLGERKVVYGGGAEWVAPVAWARNGRSLVVVRGNPYAPMVMTAFDPATGDEWALGEDAPGAATVGFSADGDRVAAPIGGRPARLGLLPASLGIVLGPVAVRVEPPPARVDPAPERVEAANAVPGTRAGAATGVMVGPARGPLGRLELAPVADLSDPGVDWTGWDSATGVAMAPDGRALVVGLRRDGEHGVEERLVELALSCQ